jgi:non-specific serine/threonine protein kinase
MYDGKGPLDGAVIRARRERMGLTQRQLADALGVTSNTVARWERGERRIARAGLIQLGMDQLEGAVGEPPQTARLTPTLPLAPSRLIGRERELNALCAALQAPEVRMVTLLGPGGSGKSRLALEAARLVAAEFADGAIFVDLSAVADPARVASAIARPLGVRDAGGLPIEESLSYWLRDRQILLLLDNFAHLLPAAHVVSELLDTCAEVKVLVTSRTPLRVLWEHEQYVAPLALPSLGERLDPITLLAVPSTALFVERAELVAPGFALTSNNAEPVAELCARVDGLPLAIELAAARMKVFDPATLLQQLQSSLAILGGGGDDLPPRQRTLTATMRWSYGLLSAEQQHLLRLLSVFVGGFDLASVAALWKASSESEYPPGVLLASLIDHSLVVQVSANRYRLLDTVRRFAANELVDTGEFDATQQAHALFFTELAEAVEAQYEGPGLPEVVALLEREQGNLRTALSWSIESRTTDLALRLGRALVTFWWLRGYLVEGREWLERSIALPGGEPGLRASVLTGLTLLYGCLSDFAPATAAANAAAALAVGPGFERARGRALCAKGPGHTFQGEFAEAEAAFAEALTLQRQCGDRSGECASLHGASFLALARGRRDEARDLIERSLATALAIQDLRASAFAYWGQAIVFVAFGQLTAADSALRRSLALFGDIGEAWGPLPCIATLARIAALDRRYRRAARLASAAHALQQSMGGVPLLQFGEDLEAVLAAAGNVLPEAEFAATTSHGRAMSLDDAIAYGIGTGGSPGGGRQSPQRLSPREYEVARLVTDGLTNRELAERLAIAERTIETHLERIYAKLEIRSRAELVRWVIGDNDR